MEKFVVRILIRAISRCHFFFVFGSISIIIPSSATIHCINVSFQSNRGMPVIATQVYLSEISSSKFHGCHSSNHSHSNNSSSKVNFAMVFSDLLTMIKWLPFRGLTKESLCSPNLQLSWWPPATSWGFLPFLR